MRGMIEQRMRRDGTAFAASLSAVLLVGVAFGIFGVSMPSPAGFSGLHSAAVGSFTVTISFSPNPVSVNTQTNGQISFTGGQPPYTAWINGTAPGCGPQSNPQTFSTSQNSFTCTPTTAGTYNIHIDAFDSSNPSGQASTAYSFTVQSAGGGGNNNGSGTNGSGSGGFSLPSDLITTMFTFAVIFFAGLFALAAGVIAMAVLLSRRLKQLTQAMAPSEKAPRGPEKPPT